MADKITISDVSMSAADNGVVISYCKRIEKDNPASKNTYDCNYRNEYPKVVIQQEDDETADDMIDRAGKEFIELWRQQYRDSNGGKNSRY